MERNHTQDEDSRNPFLSGSFKVSIVIIILALTFFHLYAVMTFPHAVIVSKDILLGIVLTLSLYVWAQEVRGRNRLQGLNEQLEDAEIDTISMLILMEEAKDPYVKGHSGRVAKFAVALSQALNVSVEQCATIERAGILHDLGKIVIPESILNKPSKLTEEEWGIMKGHPQTAVEILEPLKFLETEKKIILHHHERFDGNGYPVGLAGEDIPYESRIITVVDTFDAMNSTRSYREPLERDVILKEFEDNIGKQFDPKIVPVFLEMLKGQESFWTREG